LPTKKKTPFEKYLAHINPNDPPKRFFSDVPSETMGVVREDLFGLYYTNEKSSTQAFGGGIGPSYSFGCKRNKDNFNEFTNGDKTLGSHVEEILAKTINYRE